MTVHTIVARQPVEVHRSPRNGRGRFVPTACPDLNCGGSLVWEPLFDNALGQAFGMRDRGVWRCDGLTHDPVNPHAPLEACDYVVD